jgi:callose synthase
VSLEVDISLLTLLTDEWKNFLERVERKNEEELREDEGLEEELRLWASYRGQTLTRTGMLYLLCTSSFSSF